MTINIKQPKGMYVLGFAELFERFSYYTLSFLLVLYASASVEKGGLGWTKEHALSLAGFYTLAAFSLPIIGGFLADKFIGTFRAAMLGAFLIIIGHATIYFSASDHLPVFFTALSLLALGTSFFKPCMPTLLGRLYEPTDPSRDGGFKVYYMGINIGAMLAGIGSSFFLQTFGFNVALASAGGGMILGLSVLILGKKYLVTDKQLLQQKIDELHTNEEIPATSAIRKKAFAYLMLSFVFFANWAIIYNIAISGTLSIYIEFYTQKIVMGHDIQTPLFQSLESIGIILSTPILNYIFHKLARKGKPFHFFSQMNVSILVIFIAIAYFTHLSHVVASGVAPGDKPFSWIGISLFILLVSFSEVLISPVMMSSISLLSPAKYKTLFQGIYLTFIGIMGLAASKIGAISLQHPYQTFLTVSVITFVTLIIFTLLRKQMVSIANEAALEMNEVKDEKKKIA